MRYARCGLPVAILNRNHIYGLLDGRPDYRLQNTFLTSRLRQSELQQNARYQLLPKETLGNSS